MTIIKWKFEGQDEGIEITDSGEPIVLSSGEITVVIPQRKMVHYMNWIIDQELKQG